MSIFMRMTEKILISQTASKLFTGNFKRVLVLSAVFTRDVDSLASLCRELQAVGVGQGRGKGPGSEVQGHRDVGGSVEAERQIELVRGVAVGQGARHH